MPAGAGQQRAGVFDLTEKTVEIRRQKFPEALDRFAHERAVRAARGAERNADIDRKVVRLEQPGGLERMARGVETQPLPLRRDEIHVAEQPLRVLLAAAAQERLCGELCWPHARQRAPWRRLGQQLHGGKVIALLQNAPRHAHVRLLEPDAARGRGGLAVQRDLRGRGAVEPSVVEGGNGAVLTGERRLDKLRGAVAKELHLELLDGITLVVAFQIQLHGRIASLRYRF